MNKTIRIVNALIINEGREIEGEVRLSNGRIDQVGTTVNDADETIDAGGKILMPGVIDDQVHFREPGLTHKATIATESRAAVAGGTTSFMEMPNTVPQAVTQELLADKYVIGQHSSLANYSFFMGATNNNLDEILKTDPKSVCGVKIFMGSSTGDMLVDNDQTLNNVFANCPMLIALHCEDEQTIRDNMERAIQQYGEDIPMSQHPVIRSREACYLSSSKAVELAKKHGTRIHVLHISTAEELALFEANRDPSNKRITSEVCVHHLSFDASQYDALGSKIKCNPAIKSKTDQDALWQGLRDGRLDVIATDHAPHTWEEKSNKYAKAPSGLPLVQHSLQMILDASRSGKIDRTDVVDRMCHKPAELFAVDQRGFIREGYWADLVLVDPTTPYRVSSSNLLYKCGWSPIEGHEFGHTITHTFVNGHLAFHNGRLDDSVLGKRLTFNR
ncbi:MAG: dihydroorotase [Flavobacteriales bacterium]|nr:dihydroorotase [Flavobacteriales bacterium]